MTSTERPARHAAATATATTTTAAAADTVRLVDAPARTDLVEAPPVPATAPAPLPAAVSGTAVRLTGAALAVLSAGWAGGMLLMGEGSANSLLGAASAVLFQCSLIALVALMWRTAATGIRRAGRILLGVEAGLLVLATVQSVSEVVPGVVADTLTVVLDAFWPLSMLGMMISGITAACVGRWRGPARVWVAVATSWIALLPTMAVLPEAAIGYLMTGHILVGYAVLGVILAVRPDLTRR